MLLGGSMRQAPEQLAAVEVAQLELEVQDYRMLLFHPHKDFPVEPQLKTHPSDIPQVVAVVPVALAAMHQMEFLEMVAPEEVQLFLARALFMAEAVAVAVTDKARVLALTETEHTAGETVVGLHRAWRRVDSQFWVATELQTLEAVAVELVFRTRLPITTPLAALVVLAS